MPGPYLTPGVYIEEIPAGSRPIQGVGTAVAAFLGTTEKCPLDANGKLLIGYPHLVTSWEQYKEQFGGFVNGAITPLAVRGYFQNGGGVCYVESLTAASVGGKNGKSPARALLPLPSRAPGSPPSLELESKVADPVDVIVSDASDPGDELFKLTVRSKGSPEEVFDNVTLNKGKGNVVAALKTSKLVAVRELDINAPVAERRPAVNTYQITAPLATVAETALVAPPTDVVKGDLADRVGIAGLEAIEEITMVCMPDLMEWQRTGKLSPADARGLQTELITHCESMQRMAILDAPAGLNVQQVKDWRMTEAGYDSKYAALYYPWIVVQNPNGPGQITIPPSGYIAGIYARVDGERGVHKAPANEVVRGALGLTLQVTHGEQSLLNPNGVNCIRAFPGRGIRVWGARTLSSDTEWTYINVRRLFNYIERSVFNGTQWVVFEPNDLDLWERVKRTITAFLTNVWRDGALFGATPEEAFYVKCDAELNPASVRDAGMLIVEIGLAPVKPAEFVIFRFKQVSGGGEVSE